MRSLVALYNNQECSRNISLVIQPIVLISSLLYIFYKTRNKFALYLILIFGFCLVSIFILGLRPILGLQVGIFDYVRWAILFEVVVILALLVIQNAKTLSERLNNYISIVREKEQKFDALFMARRGERQKISNFLHNSIGLKLATVRLGLTQNGNPDLKKINAVIDEISKKLEWSPIF